MPWTSITTLGGTKAIPTGNLVVANTETEVVGLLIPANTLKVGMNCRIQGNGLQTNTTAASTSIHRIRMGPPATALTARGIYASWSVAMGTTARTNVPFGLLANLAIITIGAGGTAWGVLSVFVNSTTAYALPTHKSLRVAINTTVDNQLSLSTISGAATTSWNYISRTLELMKS